jgi:hypothetical protein
MPPVEGGGAVDVAGGVVDVAGGEPACVFGDELPPLLPPQAAATTENAATTSRMRMEFVIRPIVKILSSPKQISNDVMLVAFAFAGIGANADSLRRFPLPAHPGYVDPATDGRELCRPRLEPAS